MNLCPSCGKAGVMEVDFSRKEVYCERCHKFYIDHYELLALQTIYFSNITKITKEVINNE